jgi:hypothetical protein
MVMPHIQKCLRERTSPPRRGRKSSKSPKFPPERKVSISTNQINLSKDKITHTCGTWDLSKVGSSVRCSNKLEVESSKAQQPQ